MKTKNKSLISTDLEAILARDPATASKLQAIIFSSGFHAICMHRLCHYLWKKNIKFIARLLALISRFFTGIEIHPNAKIGKAFFIDHGMGVVIGETAEIGNNVTLYHDVTLGGTTVFDKNGKVMNKRHPTIGDNVIIGSGAQVLGPIKIGNNVKIGSNAVVVKDVDEGLTAVGVPAHSTESAKNKQKTFCAYGMDKNLSDPIDEDIKKLQIQIKKLQEELADLKNKL